MEMISQKLVDDINLQIMHEFYSAYLYLSMSAYAEAGNLHGFARWLSVQASEEQGHALKFVGFLQDRGATVVLKAIEQPPIEFGSPKILFEAVLDHERKVTALINALYEQALADKDYASQVFLQWYINEQVEEEKNAGQILSELKMIGESTNGLFMVDKQLGKRGED
jgi:ferritin